MSSEVLKTITEQESMLLCAMEWGYKRHEKGDNLEKARADFLNDLRKPLLHLVSALHTYSKEPRER